MKTQCQTQASSVFEHKTDAGFSFIEVMIVIVLMAGIAAVAVPSFIGKLNEANVNTVKIQMKSTASALDLYQLDNATFPTTEQGLDALRKKPEVGVIPKNWKGPYLKTKLPKDPWGQDYVYRASGETFQIISLGSDGEEGGEELKADIVYENWSLSAKSLSEGVFFLGTESDYDVDDVIARVFIAPIYGTI